MDFAILQNLSGPRIEWKRKDIMKMFKTGGWNITIQAGLRIVNFFDVQFNLNNGTYQPYRKPSNTPVYIIKKSNHPPVVLKQLPKSIAKRISDISYDENIFCNSISIYSEAFKKSGFNDKLSYSTKAADFDTSEKKKSKRKVIWFNPPFSLNVKTNVRKILLRLVIYQYIYVNARYIYLVKVLAFLGFLIFSRSRERVHYKLAENWLKILSHYMERWCVCKMLLVIFIISLMEDWKSEQMIKWYCEVVLKEL